MDVGSSNGTYVDGRRVTETKVAESVPVIIEFGHDGPRLRLFVGDPAVLANLPLPRLARKLPRVWIGLLMFAAVAILVAAILIAGA